MCVVSMVYDDYNKKFSEWQTLTITGEKVTYTLPTIAPVILSQEEADRLRLLIKEFREAVEAAKLVDKVLDQPDCVDPEKEKLELRVKELEILLRETQSKTESLISRGCRKIISILEKYVESV